MKARLFRSTTRVAAVLLLAACPALADEEETEHKWMETSLYVQAAGTYAIPDFHKYDGNPSVGFDIVAGIRANSWIAGEVQFEWIGDMDPRYGEDAGLALRGGRSFGGAVWATTVNARGYPLTDRILEGRFQPYLLIGLGVSSFRTENGREIGFASRWGIGLDAYVTENIALTVGGSYVWSAGTPVKDLSYVSFTWGAMYRFY